MLSRPLPAPSCAEAPANRCPQQHRQLRRRQHHRPVLRLGPDEPAALQPLGEQAQALPVPPQHLQEIAAPASKDEQRAAVRVELQHRLHPSGQPVEAFPHVGDAARQIDADIARNADHESADNTRRSAVSSTAPVIRSVTPEGSNLDHAARRPVGFRKGCRRIGRWRRCRQLPNRRSQRHRRKPGQLARAKLPSPRVKLATADPVHPANQHDRRPRRDALRQNPQLLLDAPAPAPFRAREHLAANLASPHTSTPEVLVTDQQPVIHLITAPKLRGSIPLSATMTRRASAYAYARASHNDDTPVRMPAKPRPANYGSVCAMNAHTPDRRRRR